MKFVVNGKTMNTGIADANGVQWYITAWEGWDAADIRQNSLEPTSKHGGIGLKGLYGARSLVLNGVVKAPTEDTFWNAYYELTGLTGELNTPFPVVVTENVDKRLMVVRAGKAKQEIKGNFAFEFELPLIAYDPLKYGVTEQKVSVAAGAVSTLTNTGSFSTYPTITGSGLLDVRNATTSQRFRALTALSGGAVIDMSRRTVYEGSNNAYAKIAPSSVWWSLAPGANQIRNSGPSAVTLSFYPAWL